MPFDRAIVGAGTSAAVYLCYYPVQKDEQVIVIGEPEPWVRRGGHRMGQPPHLLELPLDLNDSSFFGRDVGSRGVTPPVTPMRAPYRVPRLIRHFEPLGESPRPPDEPFLQSSRYAQSVQQIIGKYAPVADRVTEVSGGKPYVLKLRDGEPIEARQVIIASGPGSVRPSSAYNDAYEGMPNVFCSGEQFLDGDIAVKRDGVVCVEGGSATAAWAVEKALLGNAKGVFWFHRTSKGLTREQRFEEAFPAGGRNDWLRKNEGRVIWCLADVESSAPQHDKIEVLFKNGTCVLCDQYVAAIGADGALNLLIPELRGTLKDIVDVQGHLDPGKQAVLALGNEDRSLLAIGSTIYKTQMRYSDSNRYLPSAARPPEGIPTIIATIGALRRMLGGGNGKLWVDFNLKSFTDMDEYFMNTVSYFLVAGLDDGGKGFGSYTAEHVTRFVTDQVIGTRSMKSSSFGVSEAEMHNVFTQIWDFAYRSLGATRMEEWGPMLDAYYKT